MIEFAISGLLWLAALGCGVIAGVMFTFSSFIMAALERSGQGPGILVMNSINETIVRSWFMPIFLGSTLTSLVARSHARTRRQTGMNPPQKLASALVALLLAGCNSNQLRPIAPPGKSTPVARLSEGSYLVKTFAFPVDARNPALGERLVSRRISV